jgi:hypothetical protein
MENTNRRVSLRSEGLNFVGSACFDSSVSRVSDMLHVELCGIRI